MNRIVLIVACAAAVGCKDKAATSDDSTTGKPADKRGAVGGKPALTLDAYEKLILGLAGCKLVGYEIDSKCDAFKALEAARRSTATSMKDILGMNAQLGQKLISHASAPVRIKAAQLMGGITGSTTASQDVIVAAAAKETDPNVLQAFLRVVSNESKNPRVAAFLITLAAHTDVKVRLEAVYAISSGWNRDMPGGADTLLAMAATDADPRVRQAAAEYGGNLGNKVFLPFYEKVTATPATDKAIYAASMKGLVSMFHDYPLFETADEAAYNLFLKRLTDKPRTADAPPWTITSAFQYYNEDAKLPKLVAWKTKATWFKADVVKQALAAVIADKQSNWMARNGALTSLLGLGATKTELAALKKGYDDKNSDDKLVLKKIDDAIAKAK